MFASNLNNINSKLFLNHGRIYMFRKKSIKYSGDIKSLGFHRKMRCCIREIKYKGLGLGRYVFYHFVDLDLRVEIIFKWRTNNGEIYFEIRKIGTSAQWFWKLEKISCRVCLILYYFLDDKK